MKILVTDSLAPEGLEVFKNAEGFEVDVKLGLKPDELKKICESYDGWVIRSGTKITAELIEAAKNLKVIGRAGVGYENIDADAATKKGIVVMNTPGGNNVTTGEHTIALMMALARHIPAGRRLAQKRQVGPQQVRRRRDVQQDHRRHRSRQRRPHRRRAGRRACE